MHAVELVTKQRGETSDSMRADSKRFPESHSQRYATYCAPTDASALQCCIPLTAGHNGVTTCIAIVNIVVA